jgi:hypothetical protein
MVVQSEQDRFYNHCFSITTEVGGLHPYSPLIFTVNAAHFKSHCIDGNSRFQSDGQFLNTDCFIDENLVGLVKTLMHFLRLLKFFQSSNLEIAIANAKAQLKQVSDVKSLVLTSLTCKVTHKENRTPFGLKINSFFLFFNRFQLRKF